MSADVNQVQAALDAGGVCLLPTETVYGIAARANQKMAVDSVYKIKGRSFDKPLAVCVRDRKQAGTLAEFSFTAIKLADAFWPGPLTLVLPAINSRLDSRCYAEGSDDQGPTIALRCPDVDWRATLTYVPLALTSANRSGEPDALSAMTNLPVDGVLDRGPARLGQASTILSVTGDRVICLRPGALPEADWKAAL